MNKTLLIASVLLFFTAGASAQGFFDFNSGKAAVIQLDGTIQPSQQSALGSSGITPGQVRELNYQAKQQNADAIIYEINSGGGAVVASKEVKRAIEGVEMPTVCRFRDIAASGGYLVALGCDRVVADSASLTGSIGVRSSYIQYSGTLDKLGMRYINISTGEHKEIGTPYRNITDEERRILQNQTETIHSEFVQDVRQERNLTREQVEEVRTSKLFLGTRAKELGLVDHIGGRQKAYNVTENMTGQDLEFVTVESTPSFSLTSLFMPGLENLQRTLPFTARYR
jgi:protease-4